MNESEQDLTIRELIRTVRILQQQVEQLTGESQRVKLTREEPGRMVALRKIHANSRYFIHKEATAEDGTAGEILVTRRKRNGFYLSYTGNAREVTVDLWIQDRPEEGSV